MKTQNITLIAALFLNKFDKEFLQIAKQDIKALKAMAVRENKTGKIAI